MGPTKLKKISQNTCKSHVTMAVIMNLAEHFDLFVLWSVGTHKRAYIGISSLGSLQEFALVRTINRHFLGMHP